MKLVADTDNVLPVITYWLMGSLASIRPDYVLFAAAFDYFRAYSPLSFPLADEYCHLR